MQVSITSLIAAETNQIQQLTTKSDPELIIQGYTHLRTLIRAMGKDNPSDTRYKLALTTLYQHDRNELTQIRILFNKQWENNLAKTTYLEALKRLQCTVDRAVAFLS